MMDLKDAYFTVPINVVHSPMLQIQMVMPSGIPGTCAAPVNIPAVMSTLASRQSDKTSDRHPSEHGSLHDYLYR